VTLTAYIEHEARQKHQERVSPLSYGPAVLTVYSVLLSDLFFITFMFNVYGNV
jgi:hypothetical protein